MECLEEFPPDSTSLFPNAIALVDMGNACVLRVGADVAMDEYILGTLLFLFHCFASSRI